MKCSYEHKQEYENAINDFIKNKEIYDFSKYSIYFDNDKLLFDKWEYNFPKPLEKELVIKKRIPNYLDINNRLLMLGFRDNGGRRYFNVDGIEVDINYIDKQNRSIQHIFQRSFKALSRPLIWQELTNREVFIENGLLCIKEGNSGEFHISISYRINNSVSSRYINK